MKSDSPFSQPHGKTDETSDQDLIRSGLDQLHTSANAAMVNRAHRVVRERARTIKERRSRIRSLWLPLLLFSTLLIGVCIAVWSVLEEYEFAAAGSQVAGYQFVVPVLWSIPVSAALLAVVWFRQSRSDATR